MADWPLTSDLGPLGALPTAPRLARGFIGAELVFPRDMIAADPFETARKYFSDTTGAKSEDQRSATRKQGGP